ncbi:class I SAM-dependent methyltransferase [Halobaculum sp. MBLA0147]|uniref:class I SAM-dependent methyltransferase n=1 Tax=Halobaculum sp. MBLA0147 TaxID=3079934 RepID=UPI003523906B
MDYYSVVETHDLYPDFTLPVDERSGLETYLSHLFDGIDLAGKRVLEVGAGDGRHALYMASRGADVLALEPEAAGATEQNVRSTLTALSEHCDRLQVDSSTFQEFEARESFDFVFMHNVVNHLDEAATQRLHDSRQAKETYRELFQKLRRILTHDGSALIADADRTHFYQFLGLDHPLAGHIEWEKHQPPSLWLELLEDVGFERRRLTWTPAASTGVFAPLTSNYVVSHFLRCHFCLVVTLDE